MRFKIYFAIFCVLFSFNFLEAKNHNFYFGFDALQYQISNHVDKVKVEGNQFFWGLQFRYEYNQPEGIYLGIDTFGTLIKNDSAFDFVIPNQNSWIKLINGLSFGGTEFKLGYTFNQGSYFITPFLITPFLAIGRYKFDRAGHTSFRYGAKDFYLAGGFISTYDFNSFLDIGLKAKALIIDHEAYVHYNGHHYKKDSKECGFEISVPLTIHLCKHRTWNIEIEPYFLTLSIKDKNLAYGSTFLLKLVF